MNNPEVILRTLDRHLSKPTRLILYGRAALALGFDNTNPHFAATMDVDAILPEVEMSSIDEDDSFWNAIEETNRELEPGGLYLTHLFSDSQVILRANWLEKIVGIHMENVRFLVLFRPAIEDLILTKMMRIDPQDREDLDFLLSRADLESTDIKHLALQAHVPEIPEIRDAFEANLVWLLDRTDRKLI